MGQQQSQLPTQQPTTTGGGLTMKPPPLQTRSNTFSLGMISTSDTELPYLPPQSSRFAGTLNQHFGAGSANLNPTMDPFRAVIKQLADMIRPMYNNNHQTTIIGGDRYLSGVPQVNALQSTNVLSSFPSGIGSALGPAGSSLGQCQEGFTHVARKLDEIAKLYEEISQHYKKYIPMIEFAMEGKNEGNVLFSSGTIGGGSSFGSRDAFQVMLDSTKMHILNVKNALEGLARASESLGRKSLKGSLNTADASMTASRDLVQPQTGWTFDWTIIADKHKYFQIRDEIEILLAHHLEEMRGYKELVEKIQKSDSKNDNPDINVARLLGDDLGAEFWKNYCGEKVFSIDKDAFLDNLDAYFQGWKNRVKKTWVEEISLIIDPTCDNVVSVIDFKCVLQWFGPFAISFFVPVDSFLSMKHFWGSLSSIESQKLLDTKEPGTFLIRFSEMESGSFVMSVVEQQSDDNLGFFGETAHNVVTSHFLLKRKKEESGKVYYGLCESDLDQKFETIEALLKQYRLTFKYPLTDESHKSDESNKTKEDEVDFALFLKSNVHLSALEEGDDSVFVNFKGRVVDKSILKSAQPTKKTGTTKTSDKSMLPSSNANTPTTGDKSNSSSSIIQPAVPPTDIISQPNSTDTIDENMIVLEEN